MGGEGTMAGMITSIRYNRSLLSRNRKKKHDAFKNLKESSKSNTTDSQYNRPSLEEIRKNKAVLLRRKKKENIRAILVLVILSVVTLTLFYIIFNLYL